MKNKNKQNLKFVLSQLLVTALLFNSAVPLFALNYSAEAKKINILKDLKI